MLVERCGVLDARALRSHFRASGIPALGRVVLAAEWTDSKAQGDLAAGRFTQPVAFSTAPCPFGGHWLWFECDCGYRCAKLYVTRAGGRFACRRCHGLRYRTQRLSLPDRWEARASKIWRRLGISRSDDHPRRPRWMRRATYARLVDEANEYDQAAFGYRVSRSALGRLLGASS